MLQCQKTLRGVEESIVIQRDKYTLVLSMLNIIPINYLSLFKIPIVIVNNIEKMMRGFLREGREKGKKDRLVNGEVISLSNKK